MSVKEVGTIPEQPKTYPMTAQLMVFNRGDANVSGYRVVRSRAVV